MGKYRGKKRGAKKDDWAKPKPETSGPPKEIRSDWNTIVPTNAGFEAYYKAQGIIPEGEWVDFMKALSTPLPTTFRFTGSRSTAQDMNEHLKEHFVPFLNDVVIDGVQQPPPTQLPWYPNGLGWQINVGKGVIRKSPQYKRLQQFLVYETEVGNLSRQEAVSMIPPLLLDVKPEHYVLDMCAAPGSKTAQLLEALHADPDSTSLPSGIVFANDADLKRAHLLIHQNARLPSANVIVTNLDASRFPKISLGPQGIATYGARHLLFDRILCDVPCSGDGTVRKNPGIWGKWSPADGNGLHSLQLRILLRAMDLLKPGGRLVYSTCSMNPAENESVVAAALNRNKAFSIVNSSEMLPALKRSPGLTSWKAGYGGKDVFMFDTYEEMLSSTDLDDEMKQKFPPTLFPTGNEKELGLEQTLRLYAHHQDTGGFYVCVLQKSADLEPTPAATLKADETEQVLEAEPIAESVVASIASTEPGGQGAPLGESVEIDPLTAKASVKRGPSPSLEASPKSGPSALKKARNEQLATATRIEPIVQTEIKTQGKPDGSFKELPFRYLDAESEQVKTAIEYYDLKPEFNGSQLYVRNSDNEVVRSVHYTSPLIKTILASNEYTRVRVVSAGVKLFHRQNSPSGEGIHCKWRACADGLAVLLPFVPGDRIKKGTIADLQVLLLTHYPLITSFPESTKTAFEASHLGTIFFEVAPGEIDGGSLKNALTVPLWRAASSMSLMIPKADKTALSNRIWGRDICAPPPKVTHRKKATPGEEEAAVPVDEDDEEHEVVELALGEEEEEAEVNAAAFEEGAKEELGSATAAV